MKWIIQIILVLSLTNCSQPNHRVQDTTEVEVEKQFPFDSIMTLPTFFKELYAHNKPIIKRYWEKEFESICEYNNLDNQSEENWHRYLEVCFYHQLFTSSSARNCARGGILRIPYFWHWVSPNPRHEIIAIDQNILLKDQNPGKGFSRYRSRADIDRIPSLYLGDLINPEPLYEHPRCGEFYTFGWCSEREMAFVQLMSEIGYLGKVVASGNHSWTELQVHLLRKNGQEMIMEVRVDNTFNQIYWNRLMREISIEDWLGKYGEGNLPDWYNKMAHSAEEANKIKAIQVPIKTMKRIDDWVKEFYE